MANKDSAEDKARYDKLKDELAKMLMKKRAARSEERRVGKECLE